MYMLRSPGVNKIARIVLQFSDNLLSLTLFHLHLLVSPLTQSPPLLPTSLLHHMVRQDGRPCGFNIASHSSRFSARQIKKLPTLLALLCTAKFCALH